MNCEESQELLDAYLDGEFDLRESLRVEQHVETCARCQGELEDLKKLRSAMARADLYYRAPLPVRKRARALVAGSRIRWWTRLAPVAVAALGVALFFLLMHPADTHLEDAVLSAHLRSLEPNHLIDVVSTDSHTVKPWFNGKVDFAPPVVDLKAQGFPLAGGRLDYLYRDQAAVLVYKRREHVINLFVWPASQADSGARSETRRGYHLLWWTRSGFAYCAVSDLNMTELGEFERLLR